MPYRNTFSRVFTVETAIALGVFAAVVLVLGFALVRYRASRRARPASRRSEWPLVEGAYVVAVLCVAAFLVWLSLSANQREHAADAVKPSLVVKVVAFQWCWQFEYVGHDATVRGSCATGHHLPTLVVPTGEAVKFEITSADVVHELWLPSLDYKVEAFPHHVNSFVATFPDAGRWEGHCAEYCGLGHDDMLFFVRAEPRATWSGWLSHHHGVHEA